MGRAICDAALVPFIFSEVLLGVLDVLVVEVERGRSGLVEVVSFVEEVVVVVVVLVVLVVLEMSEEDKGWAGDVEEDIVSVPDRHALAILRVLTAVQEQ